VGVKAGLPPIARADARLFLLGSLPGDASLAVSRYYAHPTNQFWRLLGLAIGEELQELEYDARLERLTERRVGLWDVIASASRRGSLDQSIRDAQHNRIEHLLHDFRDLRAIAFNGTTASAIGRKLIGEPPARVTLLDLPSSSAANTKSLSVKAAAWKHIREFIEP
jgi:TDG/mug DNA glycosylase family protein